MYLHVSTFPCIYKSFILYMKLRSRKCKYSVNTCKYTVNTLHVNAIFIYNSALQLPHHHPVSPVRPFSRPPCIILALSHPLLPIPPLATRHPPLSKNRPLLIDNVKHKCRNRRRPVASVHCQSVQGCRRARGRQPLCLRRHFHIEASKKTEQCGIPIPRRSGSAGRPVSLSVGHWATSAHSVHWPSSWQ